MKKMKMILSGSLMAAILFLMSAPFARAEEGRRVELSLSQPGSYSITNSDGQLRISSEDDSDLDLILTVAAPTPDHRYEVVYRPESGRQPLKKAQYHFNPISDYDPYAYTVPQSVEVPVAGSHEGDAVAVYTSDTGRQWYYKGVAIIHNGKAKVASDHFSYFAFGKKADAVTIGTVHSIPHESYGSEGGLDWGYGPHPMRFVDVYGHWAERYINQLSEEGIVGGIENDQFYPDGQLSRAELAMVVAKAFNLETPEAVWERPFVDVSPKAWYAPYAAAAKAYGIVHGVKGRFMPKGLVTRAEAVKILIQAAGITDVDEHFAEHYALNSNWWYVGYKDVPMDAWFAKYVAYARDHGLVDGFGDGLFHPERNITRAELAKVLVEAMRLKSRI